MKQEETLPVTKSTDGAEKKQNNSQLYQILHGWPQAQSTPDKIVPCASFPPTLSLDLTNTASLPYIPNHIFSVLQE